MKIIQADIEARPWDYSASLYAIVLGVREMSLIPETSTHQIALMNGVERRRYDARQSADWAAWIAARDTWESLVVDAFDAGKFERRDASPDARLVISQRTSAREKAQRAAALKDAQRWNASNVDLSPGARVYEMVAKCYAVVEQSYKRSARVRYQDGGYLEALGARKVDIAQLWSFSPADLDAEVA